MLRHVLRTLRVARKDLQDALDTTLEILMAASAT